MARTGEARRAEVAQESPCASGAQGLRRLDHYAIFMESNDRYIECCSIEREAERTPDVGTSWDDG
jgi:hypothetical protein